MDDDEQRIPDMWVDTYFNHTLHNKKKTRKTWKKFSKKKRTHTHTSPDIRENDQFFGLKSNDRHLAI